MLCEEFTQPARYIPYGEMEEPLDPRLARALAHELALGSLSEEQLQGSDEEALPSPGLTGDAVQPLPEGEGGVLEQREVPDGELN